MTKKEFEIFWGLAYANTVPISYLFKDNYSDRWFRIHSLPESKRYAESDIELTALLARQNRIITDLLGENSNILIVTGEYNIGERLLFTTDEEKIFSPYSFTRLTNIDLYKLNAEDYGIHEIYSPAFAETIWASNKLNKLLTAIANYKVGAFLISVEKNVIIAPYDGGIDFILKDTITRDFYKKKYKDWLSSREDGL